MTRKVIFFLVVGGGGLRMARNLTFFPVGGSKSGLRALRELWLNLHSGQRPAMTPSFLQAIHRRPKTSAAPSLFRGSVAGTAT